MKHIEVVAAIICDGDKIFATQRGYGEWKDWWEFPGGKVTIRSFISLCIAISVQSIKARYRSLNMKLQNGSLVAR